MAAALFALAMIGCGGGGGETPRTSTVSGRVTFSDGLPVRGAVVEGSEGSTTTTSNGTYILTQQREADFFVKATFTDGGVTYIGRQLVQTTANSQTPNANIMVVPDSQAATITGVVTDRFGNPIVGAAVLAFGSGALNSTRTITDLKGKYTLYDLLGGTAYTVSASANGYSSDADTVQLTAGKTQTLDLFLGNPGNTVLEVPKNVSIIAWTSVVTRDRAMQQAIEAMKRKLSPARASLPTTRLSPNGNPIEIQLEWDAQQHGDLYGYGVYRGKDGGAIKGYDFLKETLSSVYIDSDVNLFAGSNYSYQLTSLGSTYLDNNSDQSDRSTVISAVPLGDVVLQSVRFTPLTFSWSSVPKATGYTVYLFNQYPGFDVDSIWPSPSNTTTNTSLTYSGGPSLVNGARYYYLVVATANGNTSRSISEVGTFIYHD